MPSYWVVDPEIATLIVYELSEDLDYEKVAVVKDSEAFEARRPFPVRIGPAELLGKPAP